MPAIADELVSKVLEKAKALKIGSPQDNADITPLISSKAADYVENLVKDSESKGGKLLMKYERQDNLIHPLVIDHVTSDMKIAWEEPFGPVIPVNTVL